MYDWHSLTILQTPQNLLNSLIIITLKHSLRKKYLCFELYNSCVRKGTLWMWARISVLILYVRIRNLRVRIRIEGCDWGQGLEDWALLMTLEIEIMMYSSTQGSTFGIFTWILRSCRHVEKCSHRFAWRNHRVLCHVCALIEIWLKAHSVFEES